MSKIDTRDLFQVLLFEGKNLLTFTGLILLFSGLFITTQSFIGEFLPHDTVYLGMNAAQLGEINPKVVNFMFHDRVSFGGTLISVGLLYIWLVEFPLRAKEAWAWWVFCFSGILGFSSFLTYLGYGYFDSYHGYSSLLLIPIYFIGLYKSYKSFEKPPQIASLKAIVVKPNLKSNRGIGYTFLFITGIGIFLGGVLIMCVGMTTVFVPQDLEYMTMCSNDFIKVNQKLTPLIAHDRASFGGGLATIGLMIFFIIKCATPSKNLWQILLISLSIGFTSGIGIHFYIGYLSLSHLLPAYLGALLFILGISFSYKFMTKEV